MEDETVATTERETLRHLALYCTTIPPRTFERVISRRLYTFEHRPSTLPSTTSNESIDD